MCTSCTWLVGLKCILVAFHKFTDVVILIKSRDALLSDFGLIS